MKRPFACIGFSMLFSLVFAISVHTAVDVTAVVCFVVSIVLFVLKFAKVKIEDESILKRGDAVISHNKKMTEIFKNSH